MNLRFACVLTAMAVLVSTAVWSQALPPPAGGSYLMQKQAIAGGGQRASGGSYVLTGTVGQSNADFVPASGGTYALAGGFHVRALPPGNDIFRNGFEN